VPSVGTRSGLLVAWATAFVTGRAPLGQAAAAVAAEDDEVVVAPDLTSVERLLAGLRADGVTRLELVLPVPGDARGLPGPGPFTTEAVLAGEGALTCGASSRQGWVPSVEVFGPRGDTGTVATWSPYDVTVPELLAVPRLTVAEAEADLRMALGDATRELTRLGTARWRPGLDAPLAQLRRDARRGDGPASALPRDHPPRARALLARADALAAVLELADGDDGASVTGHEAVARGSTLRDLAHAGRRARLAAYTAAPADDRVRQSR